MNRADLWEMLKSNSASNFRAWLKEAKFISFGAVTDVLDAQTVRVTELVKTGISDNIYTVTLFSLSSALSETAVLPQPGDLVLLLFLQKYDPAMFELHRNPADAVINNRNPGRYNAFSGIGILLSPLKGASATKLLYSGDTASPDLDITTVADISAKFGNAVTAAFDSAGENDAAVKLLFGKRGPFAMEHWAAVHRSHGFFISPVDNELMETDSPVTEKYSKYAPITRDIQGAQTTDVGLGTDKDNAPVETDAPILETIHGKAPVTRDIRSPQTVTVGIGNAETGDAEEQRDAPVGCTLGEKADVTVTSKSGLTMNFRKAVLIESGDTYALQITGPVTFHSDGVITIDAGADAVVKAGGRVYIGNQAMDAHTLFKDMTAEIKNLKTFGPPPVHRVHPQSIASLTAYEQKIDMLFTPDG